MRELLLVGAGGLAREVLSMIGESQPWTCVGVLDDDPGRWGSTIGGVSVLGGLGDVLNHPDAELIVCIGKGGARQKVVDRLEGLGVGEERFAVAVDPSVRIPGSCSIGAGSAILAQVVLTADVTVGRHVVVMPHVTLTHDDVVEDCATLASGVQLGGSVRIGPRAYLGMGSGVREGVTVGADAVLGMGAVLVEDLPDGETWVGVPARPIRIGRARGVKRLRLG